MDVLRFDVLARQLSQDGSRRRLLSLFTGTALGGLLAATFGQDGDAKNKKNRKKKKSCKNKTCDECQSCRKGKCLAKPDGTACSTGFCQDGACIGEGNCPSNQECELSDLCCPEPVLTVGGGIVVCESQSALCACVNGTTFCAFGEGFGDCCTASESCDPVDGCVAP